jgi:hypothetical protein
MVRGHQRKSSTLWQQIAPLLAQGPPSGGDRIARAWLQATGWINQGEFTKVIELVDEVVPDGRWAEQPSRTQRLLVSRGIARAYTAHGPAHNDFTEALPMARDVGDQLVLGYVQSHYGALLGLDGDLDQARTLHREALTIARRTTACPSLPTYRRSARRRPSARPPALPASAAAIRAARPLGRSQATARPGIGR